ncbi:DUF1624 domain-containing protein [Tellurirhabdus rosea]|uniref:DUF1624 domain-containing protein n=1 Tax=Tellurirhabdus rosea TaxID=2674997 RepID=UPI002256B594|nr:heparan-alpha-glucosaminide N-acetyltransferase domain-containing protein [Tellurirhabdus rosea]
MQTTLPLTQTRLRISSIDALRGLVMVIMALDHSRDYLSHFGFFTDATDLKTTTPALFFTRWITHFCAPVFVFLAGMSAFLYGQRKSRAAVSRFLLTRGLWLILLEITVVNFALWFDLRFTVTLLQVIWATGFSMVVLAGLVFLPKRLILAIGLLIAVGHNALDGVRFAAGSVAAGVWGLLHQPSVLPLGGGRVAFTGYPVLAWIGILTLGYCAGELYGKSVSGEKRVRLLRWLGLAGIAAFVLIRALNLYGDPAPWAVQKTPLYTFMSFLNTTKYPPSLLYALMTLSPALLALGWLEGRSSAWLDVFVVFGRVPLFYYVLHFYLIHALSVLLLMNDGVSWAEVNFQSGTGGVVQGHGLSLGATYVAWLLIVAFLYPLCRWYGRFKARQTGWVWSYL